MSVSDFSVCYVLNEIRKSKPEELAPFILNVVVFYCRYIFHYTNNYKEKQTSLDVGHVPDVSLIIFEVRAHAEVTVEHRSFNTNTECFLCEVTGGG